VVLHEQPKQFAACQIELILQLGMVKPAAGRTIEPTQDRRELLTGLPRNPQGRP